MVGFKSEIADETVTDTEERKALRYITSYCITLHLERAVVNNTYSHVHIASRTQ